MNAEHILLPTACENGLFTEMSVRIRQACRCALIPWEPTEPYYPRVMLLGPDKGILAYLEFSRYVSDNGTADGVAHELAPLVRQSARARSELDRPVFYIHVLASGGAQEVYFETDEQLRDILFSGSFPRMERGGKVYLCSRLSDMGTFEELLDIFTDLKKNNVRYH